MNTHSTNQVVEAITNLAVEAMTDLAAATTKIAHGPTSGPTGLEMLAIAMAGEGCRNDVGGALQNIAEAISDLTAAIIAHP